MMDEKTEEKEVDTKRRLFATSDIQKGSSSMEEQACCTKLALSVYKKAWEGAKKSKFRPQHILILDNKNKSDKDEFDSDIEMGTECSSDYHENALKRESVFILEPENYNEIEESSNSLINKSEDIIIKEDKFDKEKSSDLVNSDDVKDKCLNNLNNKPANNDDNNNNNKFLLIENFAEKTTDNLMKNVINERVNGNNGIFKITKPPMIDDTNKEESQEESTDIVTVSMDIPTITIEDILDDSSVVLSECTLKTQASEDEVTDIPEDDQMTLKSDDKFNIKLKRKVKKFSGKIKDIFSKKKDDKIIKDDDIQQPQLQSQQNDEEKRDIEELCKQELTKKALEQQKKEEKEKEDAAKKEAEKLARKEKEIAKEEAERELRKKQREELNKLKELERKRREEEDKMQREHYRQKEEERMKRKEEEKMKKIKEEAERLAEMEKIKSEEMERKKSEKERKKQEKAKKKEAKQEIINTNELFDSKVKNNTDERNIDGGLAEKKINEVIPSKSENQSEPKLVRNAESPQLPKKTQQKDLSEPCIYDEEISVPNESDGDSIKKETKKRKRMRKKLSDTKQKLKHFKDRALDSFPSMQSIKNRVKDFFPSSKEQYMNYTNRDQKTFDEYRKKYPDSDGEFFSDSELIESRRSTIKQKENRELFEEGVETEERVQMLLGPIGGPLRPPRRGEYCEFNPALSEPNLSKKTPKKPKRRPPPRPPPPCSLASSTSLAEQSMENVPLDDSDFDHTNSMIIPAHIYYKTIRERWQENKMNRLEIISRSSPNLRMKPFDSISISSKRSFAPERQQPKMFSCFWYSQKKTGETGSLANNFHFTNNDSLPPIPPPRRSRGSAKSSTQSRSSSRGRELNLDYFEPKDRANLAIDALYWKPFSWKTGRCRSLTELYLRRKRASSPSSPYSSMEPIEDTLSYRLTNRYCAPPRPPLPYDNTKSLDRIYSQINKSRKKIERPTIQNRPLPLPPIPPRSYKKRSPSPLYKNENIIMRPFALSEVIMKDASVETINIIDKRCILVEKQVQTSFDYNDDVSITPKLEKKNFFDGPEDEKICYKMQHNNASLSYSTQDYSTRGDNKESDEYKKLLNEPYRDEASPPTLTKSVKGEIHEPRRERCLSDEVSLGSVTSSRSYYDAQECDTDMDNLTDLDSFAEISSCQFPSLTDNPTFTQLKQPNKSQLSPHVQTNEIVQHRSQIEERMQLGDDSDDDPMIPSRSSQREIQQCIERKLRTKPMDSTNEW